jgi:competence protein ComEC
MKLLKYRFFFLVVCFISGILAGYYSYFSLFTIITAFIATFITLLILKKKADRQFLQKPYFTIFACVAFFLLGSIVIKFHLDKSFKTHYSHQKNYQKQQHLWVLNIIHSMKSTVNYNRYEAELTQMDSVKTNGTIILNIKKSDSTCALTPGAVLALKQQLQPIRKKLNPGQFDYALHLAKKQIYHQLYITPEELIVLDNKYKLLSFAGNIREFVRMKIENKGFTKNELATINALLLGYRKDISKDMYADFAAAGVIHILAISGLHIGILLFFLNFLFHPITRFKNGRLFKSVLVIFTLWSFALLTGLSPSVVRSVTMFSFFAYAINRKKHTNTTHVLIVSMFFLLLFNPLFIFDVGFQLSYTAVFAILWIQPWLFTRFQPKLKVTRYLWSVLSVTIAAQLGLLPLSLYYFHQFPGLFFISNLVILPFLGFILGFGLLIIILSLVEWIPDLFIDSYAYILKFLHQFVSWIARQEAFIFRDIFFDAQMLFASYLLVLAFVLFIQKYSRKNIWVLTFAIIAFAGVTAWKHLTIKTKDTLIIFHQNRRTLIARHNAKTLTVYSDSDNKPDTLYPIKNYRVEYPISKIKKVKLPDFLSFYQEHIIILDTLAGPIPENSALLLRNSPKINLERVITQYNPKLVIADGSNYRSFKARWKSTCRKLKLPFHDTSEKGAYILNN